jgi:hypothetical protein
MRGDYLLIEKACLKIFCTAILKHPLNIICPLLLFLQQLAKKKHTHSRRFFVSETFFPDALLFCTNGVTSHISQARKRKTEERKRVSERESE